MKIAVVNETSAAMQCPGVFCGHIANSLDAWLFTQIYGRNCISLMLNQGYGWAGDANLRFIFDRIFSVERGGGWPAHRKASQKQSRETLETVSALTHRPLAEIIALLPDEVIKPALEYPGIKELVDVDSIKDIKLRAAFQECLRH